MSADGEAALIDAAKRGSVEAFTALVLRYRTGLLRFLVTRCRSFADAEDALQETMMNAYRYIDGYDERWRFSTWLYRIAIRNAGRLGGRAMPAGDGVDPDALGNAAGDPLTLCIAASDADNLWLTAKRLFSEDVFTALWLRYVEDMSIGDIAMALERTAPWTKVNLMRARQALATRLAAPQPGSIGNG